MDTRSVLWKMLSFDERTGGSGLHQSDKKVEPDKGNDNHASNSTDPTSKENYSFDIKNLRSPTEPIINTIFAIAKEANPKAKEIIECILKTCSFFNESDISHIAYIFATIHHECTFGAVREELYRNSPMLENAYYEPVFSSNGQCIKMRPTKDKNYKQLELAEEIMVDSLLFLDKIFQDKGISAETKKGYYNKINNYLKFIGQTDKNEFLSKVIKFVKDNSSIKQLKTTLLSITDTFIQHLFSFIKDERLERINLEINKENLLDVFKKVKPYNCGSKEKIPPMLTKHKISALKRELKDIPIVKPPVEKIRFYHLHLQLMMLHWLIHRIKKSNELENDIQGDGEKYKGRGFVQVTGRAHYKKFTSFFSQANNEYHQVLNKLYSTEKAVNISPDLVNEPKLAENTQVSAVISVGGMVKGEFMSVHGVRQSLRINGAGKDFNFLTARRIINGQDQAEKIKGFANRYQQALLSFNNK